MELPVLMLVAGLIRMLVLSGKSFLIAIEGVLLILCSEGDWVHLYGSLKALGSSKSVTVLAMRKITDFNEVTFHFLEAITAHKIFTEPNFLVRIG